MRPATWQGDTYLFKHFDTIICRKLADITPDDIERVIDGIDAPSTRRSAYIHVSGLFSYLERSPVGALEPPPHQPPRHRVLNEDELRIALGVDDTERTAKVIRGAVGKRLTYRQPRGAQPASA